MQWNSNFGNGKNRFHSPQSDDEWERLLAFLEQYFFKKLGWVFLGAGALLVLIGVFGSFYTVEPEEEAVVTRFGRYLETELPGLHFKIPFGVDRVMKLRTKRVLQEEFGFRSQHREEWGGLRQSQVKESHMLTGDLNVAEVEWVVQYQISNPKKFLFHSKSPIRNIRDVSESVMRKVVGDRLVTEVLTTGRVEIALEAQRQMQEILDHYDIGIRIVQVLLQDVNPPDPVKPSFNEVNAAKQEQERMINLAEKQYNQKVPEARGKAEQEVAQAQGYAMGLLNRSKGDASRFLSVLKEYQKAPKVTKERIYIESMEKTLGALDSFTVIDARIRGLVPFLKLSKKQKDDQ